MCHLKNNHQSKFNLLSIYRTVSLSFEPLAHIALSSRLYIRLEIASWEGHPYSTVQAFGKVLLFCFTALSSGTWCLKGNSSHC